MPPIVMHLPTQPSPQSPPDHQESLGEIHALPDLAVFQATGTDAISFMQSQITNDIESSRHDQSKLAGYCTAQGRLLATMVLQKQPPVPNTDPAILGLIKQDLSATLLKRLSMFILRAKVKLSMSDLKVFGVYVTDHQIDTFQKLVGHPLPLNAWDAFSTQSGNWICAPTTVGHRWWWIAHPAQIEKNQNLIKSLTNKCASDWHVRDIQAGLPWIELATQDVFIPQTLNLDLIEGVSFTKGCYPGQEIVARSHYRGTLKKRMVLGQIDDLINLKPGVDIFERNHPDQPCGRIINVAGASNKTHILFECTFEAMDRNQLVVASAEGPAIKLAPLPYEITS